MGVRDSHGEATGTPDPVDKGFATLNTIRIGVKAMVQKVRFDPVVANFGGHVT
jgi:hypothetical protein